MIENIITNGDVHIKYNPSGKKYIIYLDSKPYLFNKKEFENLPRGLKLIKELEKTRPGMVVSLQKEDIPKQDLIYAVSIAKNPFKKLYKSLFSRKIR